MRRFVKALLPAPLIRRLRRERVVHYAECYSQEGEDLILRRLFEGRRGGFYVDVGAHHPQRMSNTYFFYLQGWRGINVDAMPGSMEPFDRLRPEDTNVEAAISDECKELAYYVFNEPALNGFSRELSMERANGPHWKLVAERTLKTKTLLAVLDEHLPPGRSIDFLSVDVEGLDLAVLRSNDWSRFRPSIVLVEDLEFTSLDEASTSPTVAFMKSQGYRLCCKTVHTLFFKDSVA